MRKDISVETLSRKEGIRLNKSKLARQYGCCWKTIDRRLNPEKYKKKCSEKKKRIYTSKLDDYKALIESKVSEGNIPATGIFTLLKIKYGYTGGYGIVRNYVRKVKADITNILTIRFETIPGYQSQVDWKETLTLTSTEGIKYTVNIFLMVLGYSRMKYIELTTDKTQATFERALINSFEYFGGTTAEILFDNMKTVVDHAKSDYRHVVLNNSAVQFAKDANFKIITCLSFRPQTKGKVETLAKIMNRLKAFDHEFKDLEELDKIVKALMKELNYEEKSQATNEIPCIRFEKEKEYLTPVNIDLLKSNILHNDRQYKVTKESMITYKGIKYSVPTEYVGKYISVNEDIECIHLYFNTKLIRSYKKDEKFRYNYKKSDYLDILEHSDISAYGKEKLIENINNQDLRSLNEINIEEDDYYA